MLAWAAKVFRMSNVPPKHPLIAIVGATGTGKSELAVHLARRFNGEVINGDALQMYEGLPIITNKISPAEQRGIPHHLLGVIKADEEPWTVTQFVDQASKIIEEIRSKERLPILVGGTHYYTQSLLFRDATVGDATSRTTTMEQIQKWPILNSSTEEMLVELRRVDPIMAKRWHPHDRRKIRRSLEIYLTTGRKASEVYEQQKRSNQEREGQASNSEHDSPANGPHRDIDQPRPALRYDSLMFWTHADSKCLNERLDKRVDHMNSSGLLDEVRSMCSFLQEQKLQGKAPDQSRGIWVAIGFKEFLSTVEDFRRRDPDMRDEAIERTKIATRQYAQRQTRWIRLRLQRVLYAAKAQDRLFLLDASDPSKRSEEVERKAFDITESFLKGDKLPHPASMSSAATGLLVNTDAESKSARFCESCDKTLMSDSEWTRHLSSKGHKAANRPRPDWKALYPKREDG